MKETWTNARYTLNRTDGKLEQETLGTFTQYPLRLAWAITIHKSQGLTFEKVMIDAGSAFSSGQVYVALSRCTSLSGVVLLSKIPASAIYSNENVIKGQESLSHKGSLAERFAGARQVYTQQLLDDIFSFKEVASAIDVLQFHIIQQKDKLNQAAPEWINKLKEDFAKDKSVGEKFVMIAMGMMKDISIIEENNALQKRINGASAHFEPRLADYLQAIKAHPLVTEHKETATLIDEFLQALATAFYTAHFYVAYCSGAFSVTSFLQHKLKFALQKFNLTSYASNKRQSFTDSPNPELYDTLKRWRDMVCEETGQPIYLVVTHQSLKDICTYLPLNRKDLQLLSGFGKAKVHSFGENILEAVESYCSRQHVETNMHALLNSPKRVQKEKQLSAKSETKIDTKLVSFDLFKAGKTIEEIAAERNFLAGTIYGHLAHYITTGDIQVDELLTKEQQKLIADAITNFGVESLSTLVANLPSIGYGEIRIYLAANPNIAT